MRCRASLPFRTRLFLPAILAGLLLLPGCILIGDDLSFPTLDHASTRVADLVGPSWLLTQAVSDEGEHLFIEDDSLFTVTFSADGVVGGRSAYNGYFGHYTASDNGTIRVDSVLATTLVNIPREYQALHDVLLGGVIGARAFEVGDAHMHLYYGSRGVLRFEEAH